MISEDIALDEDGVVYEKQEDMRISKRKERRNTLTRVFESESEIILEDETNRKSSDDETHSDAGASAELPSTSSQVSFQDSKPQPTDNTSGSAPSKYNFCNFWICLCQMLPRPMPCLY